MMRRSVKGLFVVIGWVVLYLITMIVLFPVVYAYYDTSIQGIPLEYAIPVLIMLLSVGIPILYTAIGLITPLVMATIEVFDREH